MQHGLRLILCSGQRGTCPAAETPSESWWTSRIRAAGFASAAWRIPRSPAVLRQ